MIPILFDGTARDFTTNGIGRLSDAYSCTVTEEKNGIYELTMKYPVHGKYYSEIQNERIIVAVPYEGGSRQAFVIYDKQDNMDESSMIRAQHISYLANYIPVLPFKTTGIQNAISVLNGGIVPGSENTRLAEPSPFTITTDIVNDESLYQQHYPRSLRSCLGGDSGSLLDTFATKGTGEYEWDNFDIKFWNHRGSDKGYTVRYGKNLVSLDRSLDSSDFVTGVLPYWTNGSESESSVVYEGDIQYIDNYDQYPFKKTIVVDFSSSFSETPSKAALEAKAKAYVDNLDYIKDDITLEFYDIDDQRVHLCDTITIKYDKIGVSIKQKIIKTVWDVLSERYDTITVGNDDSSLSKTLYDAIEEGKDYTNSKMISVNQRVDYEIGVIEDRISSVEEETGKGTLMSVSTMYLRNDGTTPSYNDPNWTYDYPPTGTGSHIWSMTIYEYLDPQSQSGSSYTYSTPTEITANGITNVITEYLAGTAATPSDNDPNWSSIMPSVTENTILWTRNRYVYSNGPDSTSVPSKALNSLFVGINSVSSDISDLSDTVDDNMSATETAISNLNTSLSGDISSLSGDLSDLSGTVASNKTAAETAISNLNTSLSGDISDLSDTVDANKTAAETAISNLNTTLSGDISAVDTKIDNVETSLSGDISAVDGRVTTLSTTVANNKVVSIETRYAKTAASDTSAPGNTSSSWNRQYPTSIAAGEHIWEQTRYKYADNTYGYSTATEITDRDAGNKITNIETRYAKTAASDTSAPANTSSSWNRDYPTNIVEGDHIWEQTKYTYADNTVGYSTATELTDRAAGYKVTGIQTMYAKTSTAQAPGTTSASWSTTYPNDATTSEHIWEMTRYQYANGAYGYSAVTELYDRGVSNVVIEYAVNTSSSSPPDQSSSSWSINFPSSIASNQYLWTRTKYTTLNGAADYYSTPTISQNNLATQINTANQTANTANTNASNAVSTANTANTNATNAVNTANTANQTANTANTNASNAVSTANTANQTANTANTNASNAVSTANTAKSTADSAYAKAGEALKSTTIYYKKGDTKPAAPTAKPTTAGGDISGWSATYPSQNYGDKIWTTTLFEYNNGTFAYSAVVEVTEPDVTSVVTKYLQTATNSTPSKDASGWSDTMPAPSQTYPYLWTMVVYTKSNNSVLKGDPTLAMANLYQAVSGTLTNVETLYATSTTTTAPTDGWSTSYPSSSQSKGKHVWQRLRYTFADGHTTLSTATEVTESGIDSVVTMYYLSTSGTTPPDKDASTGWTNYVPTVNAGYYLWSMEVYTLHNGSVVKSDPTLAMNSFYSELVSHNTRITRTETDITLQADRITTVSQSVGVNLTPFFGHDFTDVVGSDEETDGYWEHAIDSAITQDKNGWAHFDASIANSYFSPVANLEIDFQILTVVVEISNLSLASSTKPFLRFQNGSNNQQYQSDSNFVIDNDGVYRFSLAKSSISQPTRLVRGLINRGAAGNTFDIRLSLFKETYTGDYIPYVTPTNDLEEYIYGLRNAIETASSQINTNAEGISNIVKKTETFENDYITKSGADDLVSKSVSAAESRIDQRAGTIEASITQTQTSVDNLKNQYESEISTHFKFDLDGLEISSSNSDIKGKFDNDSLDFINNNTTFGWMSAEEGVGGNKVSIGDAETSNKRWLIFPDSTGTELRFARHS